MNERPDSICPAWRTELLGVFSDRRIPEHEPRRHFRTRPRGAGKRSRNRRGAWGCSTPWKRKEAPPTFRQRGSGGREMLRTCARSDKGRPRAVPREPRAMPTVTVDPRAVPAPAAPAANPIYLLNIRSRGRLVERRRGKRERWRGSRSQRHKRGCGDHWQRSLN